MHTPDFLIIGAMKCGTSTLAAQLGVQQDVFMTTPKEPNFFSDDAVFAKGPDWYASLFDAATPGDLKGEASTHYTKLPTYPKTVSRLQAALPAPRLIYMIRNPVARAVSHYIHEWSEGRLSADANKAFASAPELTDYGCYGMQIAPFIKAYGRDTLFLTSLEQIQEDPEAEFARIIRFLGLPETAVWLHDLPAQNVSAQRMRRIPLQGLLIDNPTARKVRHMLVPAGLRTWVRNQRTMTDRPNIPEGLLVQMQDQFAQDRAVLSQYFPDHPALNACYPFISA